jgi:uncharacterized protein (TIGR00369 family)
MDSASPPELIEGEAMARILDRARQMVSGKAPQAPILQLLDARLTSIEPGRSRIELDADDRHANPMGTLHGGVLCDIADAAMGIAYASTLEDDVSFTTLELKINFLRPVWRTHLIADGVVVHAGKTVGMAECSVTDEKGRLVAKATSTCLTLKGDMAAGR